MLGDSERQDGDNFAIGVALQNSVHDVVLRRVTMMNSHDTTHEYWNGDGFMTDKGVYNLLLEDTVASGSTDAGYDLKSSATTLLRSRAEDNARNYRIWGESAIEDCISRNPHKRGGVGKQNHFWIGKGARAHVIDCQVEDQDPETIAFEVEQGGEMIVQGSSVTVSPQARMSLIRDGGSLDFVTAK